MCVIKKYKILGGYKKDPRRIHQFKLHVLESSLQSSADYQRSEIRLIHQASNAALTERKWATLNAK